ncbi:hypothetical protein CANCADRAFT_25083 [Tortispora caseinolytica NRRL Y-17796]|uniref:Mitochondrial import inner membrane translocase subunit n=1 Tax=Tortispora caseinolytica NRRL Y-17796 TaxID=767744 RepID=A0A1E4TFS8_9ASCO|nr:hypothetical protein CANCADRAFT_25083 [Tortispora caseinolytica NRRL Y-17796]
MSAISSLFGKQPKDDEQTVLKQQLQEKIKQEFAVANISELVNRLTENCFNNCITTPTGSLDTNDQNCISQCATKYTQAWNIISKTYIQLARH